jgi:predicted lipoprotein with Yx(FWY)xxD motif
MLKSFLLASMLSLSLSTAALAYAADSAPTQTGQTSKGPVLTDAKGMTLYTFTKDSEGKSACSGKCAEHWPPLAAAADAKSSGDYSVITRDGGAKQWAYKGKPLYTWAKDSKPGDITGDGLADGAWQLATP